MVRGIEVTAVPGALPEVMGIANIKGKVITLLDMEALRKPPPSLGQRPRKVNAVVLKGEPDQMGLTVDRPGDLIEIEENKILPLPVEETEKGLSITGIVRFGETDYKIINIEEMISRFGNSNDQDAKSGQEVRNAKTI